MNRTANYPHMPLPQNFRTLEPKNLDPPPNPKPAYPKSLELLSPLAPKAPVLCRRRQKHKSGGTQSAMLRMSGVKRV